MWDDSDDSSASDGEVANAGEFDAFGGGGNWDDEDEDSDAGDWDKDSDDEAEKKKKEEAEKAKKAAAKPTKPKKKTRKDMLREREAKEKAEMEARLAMKAKFDAMTDEEKAALKAKENANKERMELSVAGDLFDESDYNDEDDFLAFKAEDQLQLAPVPVTEDELKLESKQDHEEYAKECLKKLTDNKSKTAFITAFLRMAIREGTEGLTLEQVSTLKQTVNLIHKEKAKERSNKKKKGKKAPSLNRGRGGYDDGSYDGFF